MNNNFKILSIDGGGYRGVYSAHVLQRIEEEFEIDWQNDFNLIAGTSTGSIIAAGLACGLSATEICDFYKKHGKEIFEKSCLTLKGLFTSKYDNKPLKYLLTEIFGEKKLSEVKTPLIIPSTDIGNGCVHVFKSNYNEDFYRDKSVNVSDAILASCSAPTYFNPHKVGHYMLADGGLWANNPSLVAVIDAKRRLNIDLQKIKVFSVGSGIGKKYYSQKSTFLNKIFGWGAMTRWGAGKFIDMVFNLQSQSANNMLGLILDPSRQVLRINFETDTAIPLDDVGRLNDWLSRADKDFAHKSKLIADYLKLERKK